MNKKSRFIETLLRRPLLLFIILLIVFAAVFRLISVLSGVPLSVRTNVLIAIVFGAGSTLLCGCYRMHRYITQMYNDWDDDDQ